ncbi:hypothetical protein ACFE04_029064 [Oxalis oulophora]
MGVCVEIVHNASMMNAIGICGLQLYRYGKTHHVEEEMLDFYKFKTEFAVAAILTLRIGSASAFSSSIYCSDLQCAPEQLVSAALGSVSDLNWIILKTSLPSCFKDILNNLGYKAFASYFSRTRDHAETNSPTISNPTFQNCS